MSLRHRFIVYVVFVFVLAPKHTIQHIYISSRDIISERELNSAQLQSNTRERRIHTTKQHNTDQERPQRDQRPKHDPKRNCLGLDLGLLVAENLDITIFLNMSSVQHSETSGVSAPSSGSAISAVDRKDGTMEAFWRTVASEVESMRPGDKRISTSDFPMQMVTKMAQMHKYCRLAERDTIITTVRPNPHSMGLVTT
jgi:hypothetical protein